MLHSDDYREQWSATVRNLFILIRKRWPVKASSKEMSNLNKRWSATVRNLFILIRKRWPAKASSKKMINFNKRWPATVRNLFILIREGWRKEERGAWLANLGPKIYSKMGVKINRQSREIKQNLF